MSEANTERESVSNEDRDRILNYSNPKIRNRFARLSESEQNEMLKRLLAFEKKASEMPEESVDAFVEEETRKVLGSKKIQTFYLPELLETRLEAVARILNTNKSRLVQAILEQGLE